MLPASQSFQHSFNLFLTKLVQPWLVLMRIQCSCRQILLFLHHHLVLSSAGLFAACCDRLGCLVSHDELIDLAEQARAPHPICNPAKPGRISEKILVMRSQVDIILD